jgi:glycogen operon protein
MTRDLAPRPGVTLVEGGADVAVYAGHADAVELCLFDAGDKAGTSERRHPLTGARHTAGGSPSSRASRPGSATTSASHGAWSPDQGLRHNPAKLLLDPYAKAIEGKVRWGPEVYGHVVDVRWHGDGELISASTAAATCRAASSSTTASTGATTRPAATPLSEIGHLRDPRAQPHDAPAPRSAGELRGTYAGLAHPATIDHLTRLGVTAVELLPVHAFTTEPHLWRRGLTNHWGYNTLGFFAPHARYAAARDPQGAVDEFKGMVKLLHAAGIEVILDVVYNHTAEQAAARRRRCPGAAWTSAPTTGSTSGATTSTSPAAATRSTCATPSSAA